MRKPTFLLAAFLTLVVAGLLLWRFYRPVEISTERVVRGSVAEIVYATGVVEPERWAKVMALQRKRIVDLCRCEGQSIKAGHVLGQLDNGEELAVLSEFEARRERLVADAQRLKALVEAKAAPKTQLDQLVTQLREIEARILAQKDRLNDLVLKSPLDGVVLRSDGQIGEIAGTGPNDVLFWIGQTQPLRIVAEVNEEDIPLVAAGQKVWLRAEGFKDRPLEAKVVEVTPKGDPATKTFRVFMGLPEGTPLHIGMSVEANIVVKEKESVLLLPAESLGHDVVFVVAQDRLRRQTVKVGLRGARKVEIVDGLMAGDVVASPFKPSFHDGMRVKPTP